MKPISGRRLIQILKKHRWIEVAGTKHRAMRKGDKKIMIPVHGGKDLTPGLQARLMKDTGLKDQDL